MGLCGGGCQRGWIEDELGWMQAIGRRVIRENGWGCLCVYRLMIVVVPYIADLVEYEGNKMMIDVFTFICLMFVV